MNIESLARLLYDVKRKSVMPEKTKGFEDLTGRTKKIYYDTAEFVLNNFAPCKYEKITRMKGKP